MNRRRAFTVVEILVVVVVIAILAAIVTVSYRSVTNQAKVSSAKSNLSAATKALELYRLEKRQYPTTLEEAGIYMSDDVSYEYSPELRDYCMTVTVRDISYFASKSGGVGSLNEGSCDGHGRAGIAAVTNHSTNPSFEYGSGTVEVRRNLIQNPNLRGTTLGSTAAGITAARVDDNTVSVAATAGNSNYWSVVGLMPVSTSVVAGSQYTFSIEVRSSNTTSKPTYYFNNTSGGYMTMTGAVGATWSTLYVTFTAQAPTSGGAYNPHIGFSGINGLLEFRRAKLEQVGAFLPYFDGSMNSWQSADLTPRWVGAANASQSVLEGVRPEGAQAAYGNPVWLSSDNPSHGSKFARSLVKQVGSGGAYLYAVDTQGVSAGSENTYGVNARLNRAVSGGVTFSATPKNVNGGLGIVGNQSMPANQWRFLVGTRSPEWPDAGFFVSINASTVQVGDIIDIDNHYVIPGTYTGNYFDGSSQFWKWSGEPNRSTSTGAPK